MAAVVEPKQVEAQVVAVATAAGPPMDYVAFANLANLDHCKTNKTNKTNNANIYAYPFKNQL